MPETDSIKSRHRSWIPIGFAAGFLIALQVYRPETSDLWVASLLNGMHVVIFAAVAALLHSGISNAVGWGHRRRAIAALVITMGLGLASELAQIPIDRNASIEDLLSNWAGAIGAVLIIFARQAYPRGPVVRRRGLLVTGCIIICAALWPFWRMSAAYVERYVNRPVLLSFDSHFARVFATPRDASLHVTQLPGEDGRYGVVSLHDGSWPGIAIHNVWPDWQGHSELVVDVFADEQAPDMLHIRVHDAQHRRGQQQYDDRFNQEYLLTRGHNRIRIPLEMIARAPNGRRMDMSQIDGIVLFTDAANGRRFGVVKVALE